MALIVHALGGHFCRTSESDTQALLRWLQASSAGRNVNTPLDQCSQLPAAMRQRMCDLQHEGAQVTCYVHVNSDGIQGEGG